MKKISLFTLSLIFTAFASITAYAYQVIPSGEAVGVTIKTKGLLITGISKVTNVNGHTVNAALEAGIRKGDIITEVDGITLSSSEELAKYLSDRSQEVVLTIERKNKSYNKQIKPVQTVNGSKLGIWVRDSIAGIGTITFIDPNTGAFAGLGHGISDIDTNDILPISSGNILKCSITEPTPGKKGEPGELNGIFSGTELGKIEKNSEKGIFGYTSFVPEFQPIEVAQIKEIRTGNATILANVDGNGTKSYDINIKKIAQGNLNYKNMVIEIIDPDLLEKTGGIVQGMSGAPILQNGKLIGAVTHVFVDNPRKGYAIFAEQMLIK